MGFAAGLFPRGCGGVFRNRQMPRSIRRAVSSETYWSASSLSIVIAMPKPPGRCIFCERHGLSKEHVLSKWIRRRFRIAVSAQYIRAALGQGPGTTLPLRQTITLRQGTLLSWQLHIVCRVHCNNGWMGKLEQRVKPHLLPLLYGNHRGLSRCPRVIKIWGLPGGRTVTSCWRGFCGTA